MSSDVALIATGIALALLGALALALLDDGWAARMGAALWLAPVPGAVITVIGVIAIAGQAPQGCNVQVGDVVTGIITVTLGCIGAVACVRRWRYTFNPLWLPAALGLALVVLGTVGQRANAGTESSVMVKACGTASPAHPGIWDAQFHMLGLGINIVEVAGLIVLSVATCALLLIEGWDRPRALAPQLPPLEADDSV